jgi:hypothetical protein
MLDLVVQVKNETARIACFIKGEPAAAGTKLRIFHPDNKDEVIAVNAGGAAVLPVSDEGLYIIRMDLAEERPGVWGKRYYGVRHRCDYALEVE